jgi:hypothetical protein
MTDRPKLPRDANQLAKFIVDLATGEVADHVEQADEPRNPKQVLGGKRRAENLTSKRRTEIAKKAAMARWEKTEQSR